VRLGCGERQALKPGEGNVRVINHSPYAIVERVIPAAAKEP